MMFKTKHFLSYAAALAVATILCGSLTSCGDDEDELYPPKGNGLLVTSVGPHRFTYDESGKLTGISHDNETLAMQGDKLTLNTDDGTIQMSLSFNSDGLLTKIKFIEEDKYYKDEGTINYSYSGHRLKSLSFSAKGTEEHATYEESGNANFTWKDGNLVQVAAAGKESEREEGVSYSDSWETTYTFTYGSQANKFKQFPYFVGADITGYEDNALCVVGFYGYGPDYLPTSCTEENVGNGKTEKQTNTLSFTLNADGILSSESRGGRRVDYTYGTAATRAAGIAAQDMEHAVRFLRSGLFRHRRR